MPDYSLGRAHGKIEITYDGSGAGKAVKDLDSVAASSTTADKSLSKTQKTLKDTDRQFDNTADAAKGYSARLKEVRQASDDVDNAQRNLNATLLDSKATADDVEAAYRRMEDASKRHAKAVDAERDAHRALTDRMSVGQRVMSSLSDIIPNLSRNIERLGAVQDDVSDKTTGLARTLGVAAKAAAFFGPQGKAAAAGLTLAADGIDKLGDSAKSGSGFISGFVKEIAGFELAVGKVGAIAMGIPSLGGLAGLGGAAGVQGIINIAGAARQLSGVLGLLPAVAAGVGFSMQTLEVAFHGVGDALTDMMADDPKKFLEDIKNMGPAAAEAMLGIAQFRDEFKLAGGAVQDSFFTKIAADIQPLIQTWLPLIAGGMSQVSGIFGQAAHELASLLETPAAVQSFSAFIENISAGLRAMLPAIQPLFGIFQQLIVVGSSFFEQIGGRITDTLTALVGLIGQATSDGSFQAWIQSAINGFGHLVDMVINVTQAFGNIMTIADQFGGGGLLGWLDEMAIALNNWTQSTEGQQALTDFFSTVREATNAFLPMLGPLVNGLASIGTAFVQLGVATAPGWQVFFDTFAQSMAQLAPQIVALAPALNQFLLNMAGAFADLINQVGPELPNMFVLLSNAFRELLPQIGPLVAIFLDLITRIGPQLPKLFSAVTDALIAITPYIPIVVDLFRNFVSVVTSLIEAFTGVVNGITNFIKGAGDLASKIPGAFTGAINGVKKLWNDLIAEAPEWGKKIIEGLVEGLKNATGLGALAGAAKSVVEGIAGWFQHSPAKWGPFSGDGYTKVRGQQMVQDMADGMRAAQGTISAAASSTAAAASAALGIGGGAPAAGGAAGLGGALLPPHIAAADNSVLSAYLRHEFSDRRGLKGFAKDMGNILSVAESGFNLLSQNLAGTLFQALGMVPALNTRPWVKMSPQELAAQQERKALEEQKKQGPTWQDVFGGPAAPPSPGAPATSTGKVPTTGATVPLVQNPDGTWTSPNPAWAHLIQRESGGINQRQKIIDVNSGGNEAEGLFQITPATWKAHGGTDFAPNPLAATPQQQAAIAARILQRNPSGSDWGAGLAGRENAAALLSGLTGAPASGGKDKPTWEQVTGVGGAAAGKGVLGVPTTGLPDAHGAHTQIAQIAKIAKERFGLQLTSGKNDHSADGGWHPRGQAGDFSNGTANTPQMRAFAEYMTQNFGSILEELIYSDPNFAGNIKSGKPAPGTSVYDADTLAGHRNHVHVALKDEMAAAFQQAIGAAPAPAGTRSGGIGDSAGTSIQLMLPSGKSIDEVLDTADKNLSVNDQLLQAYLQGNPALATQIDAAKTPGASDDAVLGALTGIDSTINDLKAQDAVGNKNTIDALQSTQSQIARDAGFQQGKTALSTAQSVVSGAANAVTGVFKAIGSGLEALGATQDIADRLVYGVRNTEDVMKIVDNFQKYLTFAADVASATGNILSTIGGLVGAGGGSDPSGGAAGASMALSAAGQISQLIGAALQGVNMAIDFGQQLYHIAGTYVGRFLSQLTAGLGGTPLMGDVRFLLNKNTGQLITYSEDNPGNKNSLNVPSWINQTYDYGGGSNPNPQVNSQWNIYAGPGQSPGEMLNETMWMVNTQGTSGAMAAANF